MEILKMAKPVKGDKLIAILDTYHNGDITDAKQDIKKLSLSDRGRLIWLARPYLGTDTAFKLADIMIQQQF
jgi:hypothetical protein